MLDTLRRFTDRFLGRGSAAITVPVMDGALLPNRVLDEASVVGELPGIDHLAFHGDLLWASAGSALYTWEKDVWNERLRLSEGVVSAFAISAQGLLALAVSGREIRVMGQDGTLRHKLNAFAGEALHAVNALVWSEEATLLFTDGSQANPPQQWSRDLMTLGRSGRVGRWNLANGQTQLLAKGLSYAFGVLDDIRNGAGVLVSESWAHRVVRVGPGGELQRDFMVELPSYPSRMTRASDGGFWLTCFVSRTQLVEFVLREPGYRNRMVAEIDPRHWIVPALSSGHSFLEPLQGAGVKNMGVLKPWAPPRSYGLVLKVSDSGRVLGSFHSQVDGRHHGITGVAEHGGSLYAASSGAGKLLKVDLASVAVAGSSMAAQNSGASV